MQNCGLVAHAVGHLKAKVLQSWSLRGVYTVVLATARQPLQG